MSVMNFSLRRSKYTQINDGHGNCLTGLKISRKRSFPVTCRLRAGKMTEPKNGFRWRYEQNQLYKFVKIY